MAKNILFIGSGQMSEAILRALIHNQVYQPETILVNDIDISRLERLKKRYKVTPVDELSAELPNADIIVLGVRPQDNWQALVLQMQSTKTEAVIISIIAGVNISQLKSLLLQPRAVIRTIPNTLTDTGFGYSGVAADESDKTATERQDVIDFFRGFGKLELIPEKWLDMFTGFGVAGPNYIYYFYEGLVDAGVLAGLPRELAKRLALENLRGAAAMLEMTQKHPRELLDINNSPAGVGMHGLYELNNSDFTAALQRSVIAAVKRTTELGKS